MSKKRNFHNPGHGLKALLYGETKGFGPSGKFNAHTASAQYRRRKEGTKRV